MDSNQYIEVAEKVWGWDSHSDEFIEGDEQALKKEVNSWQGFGRTVEAMDKTKTGLKKLMRFRKLALIAMDEMIAGETSISKGIETTHLAALEAVRKEK